MGAGRLAWEAQLWNFSLLILTLIHLTKCMLNARVNHLS